MRNLVPVLLLALVSTIARSGYADVPPPDRCFTVGEACRIVGPSNQSGICTKSTCSRATPSGPVEYECAKCVVSAAPPGSGGATASSGGATASGGTAPASGGTKSSTGESRSNSGCAVSHGGPSGMALLAGLGLTVLATQRKRRPR